MDGPRKSKPRAAETSQMPCKRRAGTNWFFNKPGIVKYNHVVV